ncbi:hypothetical protein ACFLT2_01795 [Acidobacteriota bacterium]
MGIEYSVTAVNKLKDLFHQQKIIRPLRIQRYEQGDELTLEIRGVVPARRGTIKLVIEKFVGGGFAGQVYRVKAIELETPDGPVPGLEPGQSYAIKILIPASGFARFFRNILYALSFQGPFSPQVNPDAARTGALWQKFIRRGASLQLGSEQAVVDIYATFVDPVLGSCGEISEWIDGRLWRFEVDDNLDARMKWKEEDPENDLGSPEFRAKKVFMSKLVSLMHAMGAHELARQYEWGTCKSQPNALKRMESDPSPSEGHVAVDFRAGLALLPFLPMSPADFRLIFKGIIRGSLVQFDRGNIDTLQKFVSDNKGAFTDMEAALEELKESDKAYRDSLPDISHHHVRLLTRPKLWTSILKSRLTEWQIQNLLDEKAAEQLTHNRFLKWIYYLLGLIPFLGRFIRKLWGNASYRRHFGRQFTSLDYFRRAGRARIAQSLIRWHRTGRVDEERALRLSQNPAKYFAHLPLAILPAKLHRFFSDRRFFFQSLDNIFARPLRLYFKPEVREQWLRETVSQGESSGTLTDEEASHIYRQIKEPFIQKYLKSLAVHVCTVPVTQVVSVIVAIIYVRMHPELSWQEASVRAGLILGLFQVIPISPGSLVRGLYVTFLVWRERNFKDYSIAFYLSFFKYIGYLAFPIQMAYRYPDLARFMAGHWATGAVHIVPVFGERGALLEHSVFDLFYNYPLTIRRRLKERQKRRSGQKPRYWHGILCALSGVICLSLISFIFFKLKGHVPTFREIWWAAVWIPLSVAAAATRWAGGATLGKRILLGVASAALTGLLYAFSNGVLGQVLGAGGQLVISPEFLGHITTSALWRIFLFSVLAVPAVALVESRPLRN